MTTPASSGEHESHRAARMNCPYCNHDSLGHQIRDASLDVHCPRCLGGICSHGPGPAVVKEEKRWR